MANSNTDLINEQLKRYVAKKFLRQHLHKKQETQNISNTIIHIYPNIIPCIGIEYILET